MYVPEDMWTTCQSLDTPAAAYVSNTFTEYIKPCSRTQQQRLFYSEMNLTSDVYLSPCIYYDFFKKHVKLDKSAYVIFFFAYVIILTPYFLRNGG